VARHEDLDSAVGIDVYFADPFKPPARSITPDSTFSPARNRSQARRRKPVEFRTGMSISS